MLSQDFWWPADFSLFTRCRGLHSVLNLVLVAYIVYYVRFPFSFLSSSLFIRQMSVTVCLILPMPDECLHYPACCCLRCMCFAHGQNKRNLYAFHVKDHTRRCYSRKVQNKMTITTRMSLIRCYLRKVQNKMTITTRVSVIGNFVM
jgi:hypothetical protein